MATWPRDRTTATPLLVALAALGYLLLLLWERGLLRRRNPA